MPSSALPPADKAYVNRRTSERKSKSAIMGQLKGYAAREDYSALTNGRHCSACGCAIDGPRAGGANCGFRIG
jgi:hypothetical protein